MAVLAGCALLPAAPAPSRAPDAEGVPSAVRPYYEQTLDWRSCEGGGFDCATVTAPLDWADPAQGDIELAVIRHRADAGDARGSLLVNPGGPGVSGYDYVRASAAYAFSPALRDGYDVVGFDPRGVARSSAVSCVDDAGLDGFLYDVPEGARDSAQRDDAEAAIAEEFVDGCVAESGDLLGHLSTLDAARDLDLLRGVLGDSTLNYLGSSWGTALGTAYAKLFPERVGRVVLDGAMDPSIPGSDVGASQAVGFEASLRTFFADCASHEDCPYRGSVDDMMADLGALLARLDQRPIPAGDGRELGADTLLTAVIATLYSESGWSFLRTMLAEVENGEAAAAFTSADSYNGRAGGTYTSNTTEAFTAYNCMDYPVDDDEVAEAARERVERDAPVTAAYWFGFDVCSLWPDDPTGVREPVAADGAAPILVVGTTGDPATPYEWAVSLAGQLSSGVLVTRVGEGHTGYRQGSSCVDDIVDAYLLDGVVPDSDVTCES
jgi:pimeloyl-ACP methyl ester carboxylesterase